MDRIERDVLTSAGHGTARAIIEKVDDRGHEPDELREYLEK